MTERPRTGTPGRRDVKHERLLDQDERTGTYRLGLVLSHRGITSTRCVDLHQAALPVLTALRHRTDELVQVAVLDRLEAVYIERLESRHRPPVFRTIGHRRPAHCTSSGEVLLADLPRPELERVLEGEAPDACTSRTITDPQALLWELDVVARRGWASNVEEGEVGVVSVGAPLRGEDGSVLAAVTVVGSTERMNEATLRHHRGAVLEAAAVISRRLGYRCSNR